jgi:cysteine desulfurase family protein (TIGR01976 family)
MPEPDFKACRDDFPSLQRTHNGRRIIYLDGPAGTQVPRQVIEAMTGYYSTCNANTHGTFVTSIESDRLVEQARVQVANFLGAPSARTISFGANMTTLAFSLSRAFSRLFRPGDEVLITQLDHEANRGPWLALRDQGIVVREIGITPDAALDYDDFRGKVNERTRLVAMGWASNAFGTVNDVALARELTYKSGAWLLVDAVHYAPHFSIDVSSLGVDFLLCSAYKFYGPHVGILFAREGHLEQLSTDRLRTQDPRSPYRIETGTLNHAALVGVKAAVEYIGSLGRGESGRARVIDAMSLVSRHERALAMRLHSGLSRMGHIHVVGQSFDSPRRAPTVSFSARGRTPEDVCTRLGEKGICTWNGDFYAVRPMEILGLNDRGGVTRVGISLYSSEEDVDRLLDEVGSMQVE